MDLGFMLKKFITFFIEPYGMVLSLFVIWFILSNIKKVKLAKISLSLAFGLLFLFSYPPFANFLISNLENQYPKYDYKNDVSYIHVLGSGHNGDETQPLSSKIGNAGLKRVLEGVIIHKKIAGSKLIFTGYGGREDISTAKMNARIALALGIKEEDIILGEKAKDTQDEASFTKKLVGDKSFVLVTSASHMPRAMILFESLNLKPIAAPTAFYKDKFRGIFRLPNINSFIKSQVAMHEYWGILWSKLKKLDERLKELSHQLY
ncbi:ElyC/SanA/YdcF family protein [Sulfurimonas sp.]|uniref:ElyC/SanA/YdcF family protein n=1 Tax=Sulfurimonas sp. TaxID=2022749 RepID=UPI0025F50B89|nr:ElyC/SanA/YdcF family protein [Sulfurimonas sp.]